MRESGELGRRRRERRAWRESERESIYVCGHVYMYAFMCILLKLPGIFIVKNT